MKLEKEVRIEIKKYFNIQELVGKRTYTKHGENAWNFLDYRLLYALLIIRTSLGRPIKINYANKHQRGLRTIIQQIVKNFTYRNKLYLSAHIFGKAVDFDVQGMTANEVRNWIISNKHLFPFKMRLENNVSWVHLDVFWHNYQQKIHLFNV